MSVNDDKFVQVDGFPSAGKQRVKESVFNDELRTWGVYKQNADQALIASTPKKIECSGADFAFFKPFGGVTVWNTINGRFDIVSDAYYSVEIEMHATPASNNSLLLLQLVDDATTPTIIYAEGIIDLPRNGQSEPVSVVFPLPTSTRGTIEILGTCTNNATIDDTRITVKREI